jgi:alpha-D-xyloside xylohydrolase
MTHRIILLAASVFLAAASGDAQNFTKTENGITSLINSVRVQIQFYTSTSVRVLKSPEGVASRPTSLSVIETPEAVALSIAQTEGDVVVKSDSVQVVLNLNSGRVRFASSTGDSLLREREAGAAFADANDAGVPTHRVSQSFVLENGEAIYGLGQQQEGNMVHRRVKLTMIQGNTDDYVPIVLSVKGYGLFWDNTSPTYFADDSTGTSFTSDVGECIDYYFMYGRNADGVIAQIRGLTGQVPMFPLWTYGYWQSRERYKTQDETRDVVRKYRELGVPLDGIIQDWQYWGDNFHWNAMKFLNPGFPDPKRMVDEIHALHAHLIISVWASFGPQTGQYEILKGKRMLFDFKTWPMSSKDEWPPDPHFPSGVKVYDVYNPEARDIFWNHLNKGLFSLGIDGWWLDSSEPDHMDFKPADFDESTYLGSFRRVRNAFPLMHVGGVYDHQRSVSSEKRVFILTRSGFAGQQRYGSNIWSGDVVASWSALRNQISAGLNLSLTGIPYWNSDIGGFFLWNYPKRLDDPEYRELYVRWMQFGAFCPMMRSHGTDAPREIYQFGAKGEPIFDAIHGAINLRYALLPYIYSTSWEVTARQSTMMRALMMDFAEDRTARALNNEYMFGKSLLVSPVTNIMYVDTLVRGKDTSRIADFRRVRTTPVYLPAGTAWYDFWTGDSCAGGQTVKSTSPIDIMPLHVRAGSILPIGPGVQYAGERPWDSLEIRVYPGADAEFTLYEDETDNYNYEQGAYSTITFRWDDTNRALTIDDRKGSFPGMLAERRFNVIVVGRGIGIGATAAEIHSTSIMYTGRRRAIRF